MAKLLPDNSVKSVLSILGTNLFMTPLQLLVGILIARYLGPELKGIQSFALVIFSLGCSIFLFGLTGGTRYYLSNGRYKVEDIFISMLILAGVFTLVFTTLLYGLWSFQMLGKTGNAITYVQIQIILVTVCVTMVNLLLIRIYTGLSLFILRNKILIYHSLAYLLVTIIFIAFDQGINGILLAILIAKVIYFLFLYTKIKQRLTINYTINLPFIKDSMSYGIKTWINEIIRISNKRIDQLIIGFYVLPEALGLYSVAVAISEVSQKVPQSVTQVFFNKIAKGLSRNDQKQLLFKIHKGVFLTTLVGALFLMVLGYWIINFLYGTAYSYSYQLLVLYLPGVIFYMSTRIFLQYFGSTGRPFLNTYVQGAGILAGVPFYIFLLPQIGITGAAIGSSIAYIITFLVALYIFSKDAEELSFNRLFIPNSEERQWYITKSKEIGVMIKRKVLRR